MKLKRPGTRSNVQLCITTLWAGIMLLVLLGGHVVAGFLILTAFQGNEGMKILMELSGLHAWVFWLWMLAAITLDGWIIYNIREDRRKALER